MRSASSAALIAGAASAAVARDIVSEPFTGVKHTTRIEESVRPLFINIVEIDLTAPGLGFQLSPRDPGGPVRNGVQDENLTQTTRQYVNEIDAQIGINASFYRLENSGESRWTNNNGLAVSNGDAYSPFDGANHYALNITQDKIAQIIKSTAAGFDATPDAPLYNAVSGNLDVLRAGNVVNHERSDVSGNNNNLHPRTAVGVNSAGTKLWLVTADGRQTGFSEGMYHDEMGTLMKNLGARNAINLDGGGSTTMAFDYYGDKSASGANLRSQLINASGGERYNGTSLGVFAANNPSFRAPVALPATLMVLDNFEKNEGRFTSDWNSSGSTDGITSDSAFEWTGQESSRGFGSQALNLDYGADGTGNLQLRHLSGSGSQANNVALGNVGYVGFLLKVGTAGLDTGDFTASILIDDLDTDDTGASIEMSVSIDVIADGEWHLYQWNLADAAMWESFAGGDGAIDRANITIDSILLHSPEYRGDAQFFLDAISYNSAGDLSALVPEPSMAGLILGSVAVMMSSRRRRR